MKKRIKILLITAGIVTTLIIVALAGLFLWLAKVVEGSGMKEEWSDADGTVVTGISYGKKADNIYDLYIPATASKEHPQALFLFIHGGSWMGGDKAEQDYACRRYAKEGYITATMNYSLVRQDTLLTCIPEMLDEISACIAHIKDYSLSKGYQIDRMAIGGNSAGGHLSLLYALKNSLQSPIPIVFIADRIGPTDLTKIFNLPQAAVDSVAADIKAGNDNDKAKEIAWLVYAITGHTMTPDMYDKAVIDSLLLTASPVSYINDESVPCVSVYGLKDDLVRPSQAQVLDSLYTLHGVAHKQFLLPNSGHSQSDDPEIVTRFIAEVKKYCKQYFGY